MTEQLEVLDADGTAIALGAKIDGGNGVVGEVAVIEEDDEGGTPRVGVLWPDADAWERFSTRPRNYRQEGPSGPYVWVCDDVVIVDG